MSLFSEYISKVEKEAPRAVPADISALVKRYEKCAGIEKTGAEQSKLQYIPGYGGLIHGLTDPIPKRGKATTAIVEGLGGVMGSSWAVE